MPAVAVTEKPKKAFARLDMSVVARFGELPSMEKSKG